MPTARSRLIFIVNILASLKIDPRLPQVYQSYGFENSLHVLIRTIEPPDATYFF